MRGRVEVLGAAGGTSTRGTAVPLLLLGMTIGVVWLLAGGSGTRTGPLAYLVYLVAVIGFPGTVLWRRLTGGSAWPVVDVALGTGFGIALECLVYPIGRWLGAPLLPLVLPAVAIAFVPRRREGRGLPWWAAGGVALAVATVGVWFYGNGSRIVAIDGPGLQQPTTDAPFQLALAGEFTHHFPARVPYVAGERLDYHWMVYNHIASAHWITDLELDRLVFRLIPLELILLTVLGLAAVAVVLSGRILAAPVAALVAVFGCDLAGWKWTAYTPLYNDGLLSTPAVLSPTQALAWVLLCPLIAVTALLLRERSRPGRWVAAVVLIGVLANTKATMLPVYGVGLAAVFLYRLVVLRRPDRPAFLLGALTVLGGLGGLLVVRGHTQGLGLAFGRTYSGMLDGMLPDSLRPGGLPLVIVFVTVAGGWLLPLVGLILLRHRLGTDPMPVFLAGSLVAAVVATSITWQFMYSQVFFVRSAFGYAVLLAAWGLATLSRNHLRYAVPALAAGAVAITWVHSQTPTSPSTCTDLGCATALLAKPPLFAVLLAGSVALLLITLAPRGTAPAILVAAALGLTVSSTPHALLNPRPQTAHVTRATVTPGGIEAARWIRAHSDPDDLIATNVHCLVPARPPCPSASFWIPAYAERRVLVQGWAYTSESNGSGEFMAAMAGPFWDPALLARNDLVFTAPTRSGLAQLRFSDDVRWLLMDDRIPGASPGRLAKLAPVRFHSGHAWVFETPPGT